MSKRAIATVLALLMLMLASLFGLPLMTQHIEKQRQDIAVYVTATPDPNLEDAMEGL